MAGITRSAGKAAGDGLHVERSAVLLGEAGYTIVQYKLDSMRGHMTFDKIRHLLVQRAQHLIKLLDERNVEAEMDQILCHL